MDTKCSEQMRNPLKVGYKPGCEIICMAGIGHWILKEI